MFDVLMIDPPWPKKKGGLRNTRPNQGRSLDYPTLSVPAIFELLDNDIFSLAKPTHSVFLWTIDEFLHSGEQAMEARGYRRHARFIWDKTNGVAPAFSVRYSHEYLIWFYKPKFQSVADNMRGKVKTIFTESAREHSRKPDTAYRIIESFWPNAERLDVFSRQARPGWVQWGDQQTYFRGANQ